jgi:hypothetical protein
MRRGAGEMTSRSAVSGTGRRPGHPATALPVVVSAWRRYGDRARGVEISVSTMTEAPTLFSFAT